MHAKERISFKRLVLFSISMACTQWQWAGAQTDPVAIRGTQEVTGRLEITAIPESLSVFADAGFSKYVDVFGVQVFSTPRTSNTKIRHVAGVLAQYLDNDEDGVPDNPLVLSAISLMVANGNKGQTQHQDSESADTESENSTKTTKTKDILEFEASVRASTHGRMAVDFKYQRAFAEACFTKDDSDNQETTVDRQLH